MRSRGEGAARPRIVLVAEDMRGPRPAGTRGPGLPHLVPPMMAGRFAVAASGQLRRRVYSATLTFSPACKAASGFMTTRSPPVSPDSTRARLSLVTTTSTTTFCNSSLGVTTQT